MLRVSSDASRFYKNKDARQSKSTKTKTRGRANLQKQRREAEQIYKNKDARQSKSTKTKTRGIATKTRGIATKTRGIATSHYRKLIAGKGLDDFFPLQRMLKKEQVALDILTTYPFLN